MSAADNRKKVALVAASDMTVIAFLRAHIVALAADNDVTVITNTADPERISADVRGVRVISIPFARPIAPMLDLQCLARLTRVFHRERFDLVFSVTPKGGLMAMVSGCLARVPSRIHMFTGQVWATRTGLGRILLKFADRLIARCATNVLADSASQRQFLIDQGITNDRHSAVLASGSISGVDAVRFRPSVEARQAVRRSLGVAEDAVVLLFVGRLNRDKGVLDLAAAFSALSASIPDCVLLIVGPDEAGLRHEVEVLVGAAAQLHFVDFTDHPEHFMAAADVFCLPSYREGFGTVIIEAGACGLPVVASRIYGLTDAVVEGETGLMHEAGDVGGLVDVLAQLVRDADLRARMGRAGRGRATNEFSAMVVTGALTAFIGSLLRSGAEGQHETRV